jgi:hypothetical protein
MRYPHTLRFCAALLIAAVLAVAPLAVAQADPPVQHWQAVLVAGDTAQPVFDNAVRAVDLWLTQHRVAPGDIHQLAASAGPRDPSVEPATLERVLGRIAALRTRPGDGCFVFITSHGGHNLGIYLSRQNQMLQPAALAQALAAGCGAVPTVVVVSGCYSGSFTQGAMAAPNRIVLTAARADRPSFGCAAERTYTVYDACLLGVLPRQTSWAGVYDDTRKCVEARERELNAQPSYPQAAFGNLVRNLASQF